MAFLSKCHGGAWEPCGGMELWGALPLLASGRRPGPVCEEGLTWGGSQALVIDMCFRGKIDTCLQSLEQRQKVRACKRRFPSAKIFIFTSTIWSLICALVPAAALDRREQLAGTWPHFAEPCSRQNPDAIRIAIRCQQNPQGTRTPRRGNPPDARKIMRPVTNRLRPTTRISCSVPS